MKKTKQFSEPSTHSEHGRRDFLSLSCLGVGSLFLPGELAAAENQDDDKKIPTEVSAADSLGLYTSLLEEVRRLVLQRDAQLIQVEKMTATDWLSETIDQATTLRSTLSSSSSLTPGQIGNLRNFMSDVASGGAQIHRGLVRMRQQPLQEIKQLDTEFDIIRADLAAAANAIKTNNSVTAKDKITSAIRRLNRYDTEEATRLSRELEQDYQVSLITAARLQQLLQTVHDSLGVQRPTSELHHSPAMVPPVLQRSITDVLRTRLNPSSWLQRAIGYAVTFPILLRVSDKNNRIKLLNDALRVVPPGLRNPLLAELATDLANLN
jgi:hypothetical protein